MVIRPLIRWTLVAAVLSGLFAAAVSWYSAARRGSNERTASGSLKQMGSIQVTFKSSDSDGNDINDFYTEDVAGLYQLTDGKSGKPLRMIEHSVALADGRTARIYRGHISGAHAGYWFVALRDYADCEDELGQYLPYGPRRPDRFGFGAFPDRYGASGSLIFVMNEGGTMFKHDPKGDSYFAVAPLWGAMMPAGTLQDSWNKFPPIPMRSTIVDPPQPRSPWS